MYKKFIILLMFLIINAQNPFTSIINTGLLELLKNKSFRVSKSDVLFYLYNRENENNPIHLNTSTKNINLNKKDVFKFIIHGYTDNGNRSWITNMKDKYLEKGNFNVIAVDWSTPAFNLYPVSVSYTKTVGKYIAQLIMYLNKTSNIPYENIHLIGHSLGAHVAGFAGKYLNQTKNKLVGRITGLDPAGPLFVGNREYDRISDKDAQFVDIIHSDGFKNGYFDPLGNVDFYVNGGVAIQPGCLTQMDVILLVSCSHIRAFVYYIESINSNKFIGLECTGFSDYINGFCANNSLAIMGENINPNVRGLYFLTTNEKPPFARNGQI